METRLLVAFHFSNSTEQLLHNDDDRLFEVEDVKEIEKGEKISTNGNLSFIRKRTTVLQTLLHGLMQIFAHR